MIVAKIKVDGVHADCVRRSEIPAGLVGGQVSVEYADPLWDSLHKTAVFRGGVVRDVLDVGDTIKIPPEVLTPGADLYVGLYGTSASGDLVIPLIEAHLGKIRRATEPSGDPSTDPALPVWEQLNRKVGSLASDVARSVRTVNGVAPDEHGNVEIKVPDAGGNADLTIEGETLVIAENSTATIENETLIL